MDSRDMAVGLKSTREGDAKRKDEVALSNNDRSHVPSACRTGCRTLPQQPATDGHLLFGLALMYDPEAVLCGSLDARSCRYIGAITSMSFLLLLLFLLLFPFLSLVLSLSLSFSPCYEQVSAVLFYFARYLVSITRSEPHVAQLVAITPVLHNYICIIL